MSTTKQIFSHVQINNLTTLGIDHPHFTAQLLLQGAQLVSFCPKDDAGVAEENWLWLSEEAEYTTGVSVRGGVPICWPVFGVFDRNPDAVKATFAADAERMAKHGSARKAVFELVESAASNNAVNLLLRYREPDYGLQLDARFTLKRDGIHIELITTNLSQSALTFSQALHTYFPTEDIAQTRVTGFDGATFTDTLQDWREMTQEGEIIFSSEVDRIYHASPDMHIITPKRHFYITTSGSASTVVWNPWVETAKGVSQFADDAYQRMLCVEVANAHKDAVRLEAGEQHKLGMWVKQKAK